MVSIDWKKLIEERNKWVAHNFPAAVSHQPQHGVFGVMEEVGELAHAHLKQAQGIRMNEDHDAKAKDAIGDVTIYLLGIMNHVHFIPRDEYEPRIVSGIPTTVDEALLRLGQSLGSLCRNAVNLHRSWDLHINKTVYYCRKYCEFRGWDYEQIVLDTWGDVKKRDWIVNPNDAAEKANSVTPSGVKLNNTTDPMVWASEFVKIFQSKSVGNSVVDEGLMVGWFANAMMAREIEIERKIRDLIAANRDIGAVTIVAELDKELGVLPQ